MEIGKWRGGLDDEAGRVHDEIFNIVVDGGWWTVDGLIFIACSPPIPGYHVHPVRHGIIGFSYTLHGAPGPLRLI